MPVWKEGLIRVWRLEGRGRTRRYVVLAVFLYHLSLSAQTPIDGAFSGSVVDASGAVVVAATVEITNSSTGAQSSVATDARGMFLIPRLAPGNYHVLVQAVGFRRTDISTIVIELGRTANQILPLSIAGTAISIRADATSGSDQLDTFTGAQTSIFLPRDTDHLPIDGRQWQSFALLSPQANLDSDDSGLVSFRGTSPAQNSTQIDGASDDQSFGGVPRGNSAGVPAQDADTSSEEPDDTGRSFEAGATAGRHPVTSYTFSQAAVREFRVDAQNYSALQGSAAGGVITTISKSGSDQIHGTAFYLVRSSAFAATNPFSVATHFNAGVVTSASVKPSDLRQQFGGSFGGPILHQKLFYFYAFDQEHRDFPAVSTPAYSGFYALTPTQTALLQNRGVTRNKVNAALTYLDSLSGIVPRQSNQTVNFARLDWDASPRQRLIVQGNRVRSNSPAGVRQGPVVNRGVASLGNSALSLDSVATRWLWSRGTRLSNEVRFRYSRDLQTEEPQTPLPQEPSIGQGGYAPQISISPNGFIFGTSSSLGRRAYPDERRLQLSDTLTLSLGRHLLQLGADVSFVHDSLQSLQDQEGTFTYDSGSTNGKAGGLVDWITDYTFNVNTYPNGACPSINSVIHYFCFRSFTQSFGQQSVAFNTQEWSAFAQETWRVRSGLTLSAGVRYEYQLLPFPQQANLLIDSAFGNTGSSSIFPEDRNNFGPRTSIAWEPFGAGRGVVRAGYGLYFGRLPGATIRSALVNTALPTSVTHIRLLPTAVTLCPQVANQGFGYPCAYTSAPPSAIASTTSATVFDRHFRLPFLQEGSFELERDLRGGVTTSGSYLFTVERQLPNSVDINIAPSAATQTFQLQGGTGTPGVQDGETFVVPVYTHRLVPNFGPITDVLSNGNGSYNALVLEARRHGTRIDFRGSWTWSKAIDFTQAAGAVPRTDAQFDPFTNRYDKALSSLNYPQKVVLAAVWRPGSPIANPSFHAAFSNWLLSPIFIESSGRPYSYDVFGGTRLNGGHESINGSGGAVYLPTVGPNVLRLPARWRIDLKLSREFPLREGVNLLASAEAFNLTNHVAYSGVTQRAFLVGTPVGGVTPLIFQDAQKVASEGLNTQPFGTYTAAASGNARERQVQLGLRLEF